MLSTEIWGALRLSPPVFTRTTRSVGTWIPAPRSSPSWRIPYPHLRDPRGVWKRSAGNKLFSMVSPFRCLALTEEKCWIFFFFFSGDLFFVPYPVPRRDVRSVSMSSDRESWSRGTPSSSSRLTQLKGPTHEPDRDTPASLNHPNK